MLYGPFVEAKPTSEAEVDRPHWVVDLPADDPAALAILVRIAHGHFGEVPRALPIDILYSLTTLTHYYDATQVLIPWVDTWLAAVDDIWRDSDVLMPQFLWVTWELGKKVLFKNTARRILTEAPASLLRSYGPSQDLPMPPNIIGNTHHLKLVNMA